jgi:protein-disulfide isomerase
MKEGACLVSTTQWEAVLTLPVSADRDHIQGLADAPVTLVEYGDYEHDLLYENQRHLRDSDLVKYAGELGLDMVRFDKELADHAYAARVHEDFLSGVRSGVNGTPTFYINGVRHDDSYDLETLLGALERAAT